MDHIFRAAMTPDEFGRLFRAERTKLKKSQETIAQHAGVRRETIVQLERGQNVGLHVIMRALGALGKGLSIVSDRPDYDQMRDMLRDE
ncbi:helix-turn-helix domain-containing protein [Paraburkholderia sp. BL23I1N1]|uniref:helix-turn-helix domain-containing protein n=1 Tax=Paraburkholderia sp. BL23I1N1 TaxID=1938802 RepID=UPI000E72E77C|nr:helix-turn-helix transcriptional regulator [Paraburkholderia sp. BL23I1N1]